MIEKLIEFSGFGNGLTIAAGKEKKPKTHWKSRALGNGAGDRTRTGTLSPAADFESATSTNSITPAGALLL